VKVGLFGGTFDPVHIGHLRAAEWAREELGLDRVLLIPAAHPPHRESAVSSALDRFTMTALATAGSVALVASDLEMLRQGPSYTMDTVAALKEQRPEDEVFLILGSDAFAEIGGWHESRRLLELVEVVVVSRPGAGRPDLSSASGKKVHVVEGPEIDISSTEIRALVGAERSIRFLVPDGVADYIKKRGLYR
jgi:nicotinate-nucleotide adenylyltransferase